MKTIRIIIDEKLLAEVDRATDMLHTNRSAFIRSALQLALQHYSIQQREQQHVAGYTKNPVNPNEFGGWQAEQEWSI